MNREYEILRLPMQPDPLLEVYRSALNHFVAALYEKEAAFTYEHYVFEFMECFPKESFRQSLQEELIVTAYVITNRQPEATFARWCEALHPFPVQDLLPSQKIN